MSLPPPPSRSRSDDDPPPGRYDPTVEPSELARSFTVSTTRLRTPLRAAIAEPAAAPAAAATAVRRRRVFAAFLPLLERRVAAPRLAELFLPPFLPPVDRFADEERLFTLRFAPPFFAPERRLAELRPFDEDLREDDFRDELFFDPPRADFFEDLFFDAAMGQSPFQSVGGESVT